MCGGTRWNEEGWKPYVSLADDLAADADDADATEPLQREVSELELEVKVLGEDAGR